MFLDADKKPLGIIPAILSGRSVGAPGVVSMLALAHKQHGKLPWAKLYEPAINPSTAGFVVSEKLSAYTARDPALQNMHGVQDYFFTTDDNGNRVPVGAG